MHLRATRHRFLCFLKKKQENIPINSVVLYLSTRTTPLTCFTLFQLYVVMLTRFTTFDDKDWFVANFWHTAAQELPDVVHEFPEKETYFVNFLREPVDPTGDEEEDFSTDAPKVYEELPS